jgi:hypothetical protein
MQTSTKPIETTGLSRAMPLHNLVDELLFSLLPCANEMKSSIVNDINHELLLNTDKNLIGIVLGSILHHTIMHSWHNRIRVSARVYGLKTMINLKNNIKEDAKQVFNNLSQVRLLAEKFGANVHITDNMLNGTTIAFTFLNSAPAA